MLALYHLRFFEFDQSIAVGQRENFEFYLDPYFSQVETFEVLPSGMLLVFYNSLGCNTRRIVLDCTIRRIDHLEFGDIYRIQTKGLDYLIEMENRAIVVNAEEQPGEVVSSDLQPAGWLFTVALEVHSIVGLSNRSKWRTG